MFRVIYTLACSGRNLAWRLDSKSCRKAVEVAQKTWIRSENSKFYAMRNVVCTYLYILHKELSYKLHPVEFDLLTDKIKTEVSVLSFDKMTTHDNKIQKLLLYQKDCTNIVDDTVPELDFFPRILNLSDCELTNEENELLNKGIKYVPQNVNQHLIHTLAVDIETGLDNTEIGLKYKCVEAIENYSQQPSNLSTYVNE
ncbi:hypothetical protein M8J77_009611 [Diaphorina citri]|nr:hypothetical protein M8J77_009611 [Diaphorina citri]